MEKHLSKAFPEKGSDYSTVMLVQVFDLLQEVREDVKAVLHNLPDKSPHNPSALNGYLPESEAKKLFNRQTTWFWKMRTEGRLRFAKVGNKIFYRIADLEALLNDNFQ